jgi:hypothetical protein
MAGLSRPGAAPLLSVVSATSTQTINKESASGVASVQCRVVAWLGRQGGGVLYLVLETLKEKTELATS